MSDSFYVLPHEATIETRIRDFVGASDRDSELFVVARLVSWPGLAFLAEVTEDRPVNLILNSLTFLTNKAAKPRSKDLARLAVFIARPDVRCFRVPVSVSDNKYWGHRSRVTRRFDCLVTNQNLAEKDLRAVPGRVLRDTGADVIMGLLDASKRVDLRAILAPHLDETESVNDPTTDYSCNTVSAHKQMSEDRLAIQNHISRFLADGDPSSELWVASHNLSWRGVGLLADLAVGRPVNLLVNDLWLSAEIEAHPPIRDDLPIVDRFIDGNVTCWQIPGVAAHGNLWCYQDHDLGGWQCLVTTEPLTKAGLERRVGDTKQVTNGEITVDAFRCEPEEANRRCAFLREAEQAGSRVDLRTLLNSFDDARKRQVTDTEPSEPAHTPSNEPSTRDQIGHSLRPYTPRRSYWGALIVLVAVWIILTVMVLAGLSGDPLAGLSDSQQIKDLRDELASQGTRLENETARLEAALADQTVTQENISQLEAILTNHAGRIQRAETNIEPLLSAANDARTGGDGGTPDDDQPSISDMSATPETETSTTPNTDETLPETEPLLVERSSADTLPRQLPATSIQVDRIDPAGTPFTADQLPALDGCLSNIDTIISDGDNSNPADSQPWQLLRHDLVTLRPLVADINSGLDELTVAFIIANEIHNKGYGTYYLRGTNVKAINPCITFARRRINDEAPLHCFDLVNAAPRQSCWDEWHTQRAEQQAAP